MARVLITGAGGFVGKVLRPVLEEAGFKIIPVFRTPQPSLEKGNPNAAVGRFIDGKTVWGDELNDVDVVIHLAAKVHVIDSSKSGSLANFREVNVEGTRNLAIKAARSGVKRFVYLSSIKVNGERTGAVPFAADQVPRPEDAYAISKMEAEVALREVEKETGMEVVIIRPPLVYGPGVKGNLAALIRLIKKGIPLPLAAVKNCRDLVSIYNLCDLIRVCCLHPAAAGRTFLVCDGESISTAVLIRYTAEGLGLKARLFVVPIRALRLVASILGKAENVERLTGDLQIDMSTTQEVLGWKPPLTVTQSFKKMFAKE